MTAAPPAMLRQLDELEGALEKELKEAMVILKEQIRTVIMRENLLMELKVSPYTS